MNTELILRSFYHETQNSLGIHYCSHGCGSLALFYSKNTKRWRCASAPSYCKKIKEKTKLSSLGRKHSEESKRKKSIAMSGVNNPFYGKHHSDKTKALISQKNTGYKLSKETKKKMSKSRMGENNSFFGKKHSDKTRERLSESKRGENHPCYGKHLPASTREKISKKSFDRMLKYKGSIGAFRHVKTYDTVNNDGQKFRLHGTWEVKMAEFLNSKDILWRKGDAIQYILDGNKHLYSPDFYLPLYNKYIEVKGYYPEECKRKMEAVLTQNDIKLLMAFKKEIDNLDLFLEQIVS